MNKLNIKYIPILIILVVFLHSCRESTITPGLVGNISGEVVSAQDTIPIDNATITTNPSTNIKNTDFEGKFSYTDIPEGTYVLRVDKEGFISKTVNIEVTDGATSDIVISLDDNDLFNKPPSLPMLISPVLDSINPTIDEIELIWSASDENDDDLTYDVRIYNDDLSYDEIVVLGGEDTSFVFTQLEYDRNYFWQVAVSDGINEKRFGEVWNFKTLSFPLYPFYYAAKSSNSDIQIYSSDTMNTILVSPSGVPAWRPRMNSDKDQVALISIDNIESHIFLMDTDGRNFRRISDIPVGGIFDHEMEIDWLPDDSGIIYPNYNRLYTVNIDGTTTTQIINIAPDRVISEVAVNDATGNYAIISSTLLGTEYQIVYISPQGNVIDTIVSEPLGRMGGLDFSADGNRLLYTYDVSGFTSQEGRMLDSQIFMYNFTVGASSNLSDEKDAGTNDLDPSFSPNNGFIIFTNQDNVKIGGPGDIMVIDVDGSSINDRELYISDAYMPDWN